MKNKYNQKGFTLIEMLVVIAVVGILSATVLTALGPARNKARDSRIISGLNQVVSLAETVYDGDYDAVPKTFNTDTPGDDNAFNKAAKDIKDTGGELAVTRADSGSLTFSAHSPLVSGGWYCIDSVGNRKYYPPSTSQPTWGNTCP